MKNEIKEYILNKLNPSLFQENEYNTISIKKLGSGCYNLNFLLVINSKKYVLRTNPNKENKLKKEFMTLKKMDGFYSPKVFLIEESKNYIFIIEEYIEGQKIKLLNNKILKNIAISLANIHNKYNQKNNKVSLYTEWIEILSKMYSEIKTDKQIYQELSKYYIQAKLYCENNEKKFNEISKSKLIHGDMHCGNILLKNHDEVIYLDWENSQYNDPALDIVAFFYESENLQYFSNKNNITKDDKKLFLEEYLKIHNDINMPKKIELLYPLRWLSDTFWLASRIVNYESFPKDLKDKSKEDYMILYRYNLEKIKEFWV